MDIQEQCNVYFKMVRTLIYAAKVAHPLFAACQNEHKLVVQGLLNNGAVIDVCDEYGASPLYVACQNGHDSIVKLLLDYGADINFGNKRGYSPLNVASVMGYESTTRLLQKNGADTFMN